MVLTCPKLILPDDLTYNEDPKRTIFFDEVNPCGILCKGNHPYSIVRRFGHWYSCEGQDREAGIHSSALGWRFLQKTGDLLSKQQITYRVATQRKMCKYLKQKGEISMNNELVVFPTTI
jgi:hypothetical protein